MKSNNTKITIHEVYSHVIDVTVESIRRYLNKNKLNSTRFDIPSELKSRWQARLDCLFYFLNDSWLKFQENCTKLQGLKKKNSSTVVSQSLLHFPLVCMLSWDFFRKTHLEGGRVPGFKSWVWNCLISRVVAEGVYPSQSIVKNAFKSFNFGRIQKKKNTKSTSW